MIPQKNLYTQFDWRDPICVSHYPFPEKKAPFELSSLLELNKKNSDKAFRAFYIHVPFCETICSFCPFNKMKKSEPVVVKYLSAIKNEIDLYSSAEFIRSSVFGSIYLGGGTPTCLSKDQLVGIISHLKNKICVHPDAQITVEGNPTSSSTEKLAALFDVGVNRVSFGVQTFSEKFAKTLQLSHSPNQAIQVIESAYTVGFKNVCIDLLYNLPGQSSSEWQEDVQKAIGLNLDHITIFSLCLVPGTKLEKAVTNGQLSAPGDQNEEIDKFILARDLLRKAGYVQYSVWDFAKPDKIDQHVEIYYHQQGNLVGTGPAAFGYINNYMYINRGDVHKYCAQIKNGQLPILVGEKASREEQMRGMMAKGLRLYSVNRSHFKKMFDQYPEEVFPKEIKQLVDDGLVTIDGDLIKLTDDGGVWGNNVSKTFFKKPETFEWRASLAKGREPIFEDDDPIVADLLEKVKWEDGVETIFEWILERKPIFIRNKSRKEITRLAIISAFENGRMAISEEDLIFSTIKETPAPFRPVAIAGFRKQGINVDKYLSKTFLTSTLAHSGR